METIRSASISRLRQKGGFFCKRSGGSWGKGEHDQIGDQRMFHSEASLFSAGAVCGLRQRMGKVQAPGAGWTFNQSLTNTHFVPIDQWGHNSSAHFRGKEWEFRGTVSGLFISNQGAPVSLA